RELQDLGRRKRIDQNPLIALPLYLFTLRSRSGRVWFDDLHDASLPLIRYAFITVTDWNFFPGTLATINSVLEFHPLATVYVVQNERRPLSGPQAACFGNDPRVRLLGSSEF